MIVALPRLAGSERALRFRLGRWLSPRTTSLYPRNAGVGVVFGLLARPRGWPASSCSARSDVGSLVPTRAAVSLRGCRRRGAAGRASGRSHPGSRRDRRARCCRCRSIGGACCLCLRRRPGSLLRSSRPALRLCVARRTVVAATDRSLKGDDSEVVDRVLARRGRRPAPLRFRRQVRSWRRAAQPRTSARRSGTGRAGARTACRGSLAGSGATTRTRVAASSLPDNAKPRRAARPPLSLPQSRSRRCWEGRARSGLGTTATTRASESRSSRPHRRSARRRRRQPPRAAVGVRSPPPGRDRLGSPQPSPPAP